MRTRSSRETESPRTLAALKTLEHNEPSAAAGGRPALGSGTLHQAGAAALLAGLILWIGSGVVALGELILGGANAADGFITLGSGLIGGLLLMAVGQSILIFIDMK